MGITLRERQAHFREEAILAAVNELLAEKGYDAMTVDDVAAYLGIAKTSLYKHFESKDALAAEAMVRLLERAKAVAAAQPESASPRDKLAAVLRWALEEQLGRRMPKLPSTNSALRDALVRHKRYMARLMELSDVLGGWIEAGQKAGEITRALPPEVVLYTLYARTCDPVAELLKASGAYSDEEIVAFMLAAAFEGLAARGASKRSVIPSRRRGITAQR